MRTIFFDTEFEALPDSDPRLPRLVCVQWCEDSGPPQIALARDFGPRWREWISDRETLLVGFFVEVDTRICTRTFGTEAETWAAYEAGRISCGAMREKLIDLARPGLVRWSDEAPEDADDADDADETGPAGKGRAFRYVQKRRWNAALNRPEAYKVSKSSYGMAAVGARRFGWDLSADKSADSWRMRYVELIDTPLSEWPAEALRYALEDADRTRAIWKAQAERPRASDFEHLSARWWQRLNPADRAPLLAAERERVHYAYGLQILRETGIEVDREEAARVVADYERMHGLAREVLLAPTPREWPSRRPRRAEPALIRTDLVTTTNSQAAREGWLSPEQADELHRLESAAFDADAALADLPRPRRTPPKDDNPFTLCETPEEYREAVERRRGLKAAADGARRALRGWERDPWSTEAKEVPDRKRLIRMALRAYEAHPEILPGLTKTGLRDFGQWEGRALSEWPAEVRAKIDTSGTALRALVAPRSDDAAVLARSPADARAWDPDRIRAALRECAYPGLLASAVAAKAKALGPDMVGPLVSAVLARPRFNSLLETGRISLLGLVRQNMPRKGGIRECFRPRAGRALIVADYGQIELVAFSYALDRAVELRDGLSEGSYQGPLTRAINAGLDCHLLLGLDLLPPDLRSAVTYPAAIDAGLLPESERGRLDAKAYHKAAAGRRDRLWKALDAARQQSKAVNYGLPGGMSPRTFARTQTKAGSPVTVGQAERMSDVWNRRWEPEAFFALVRSLMDACSPLGGGVEVPASGLVLGGRTYCQVANVLFQGPTAEGFRRAFLAFQRECLFSRPGEPLYGACALLPIHDEIVGECPAEHADAALARMREIMVREMLTVLPGMLVTTSGGVLHERWAKVD